ncbi:uncharacterized protein LODBEIA_P42170 [Lodderomyces beijingensis]|uniref:Uncharacterized protein n=1 Tax=Lodderomyces beijingensis TaxID=1775926 RepID=A0ABP0ZQN8_9ASCO
MDHYSNVRSFKRPSPFEIPTKEQLVAIFNPPIKKRKHGQDPAATNTSIKSIPSPALSPQQFPGSRRISSSSSSSSSPSSSSVSPSSNSVDAKKFNENGMTTHFHPMTRVPILNAVPPDIIPIIHPPSITSDFFTDIKTDLSDRRTLEQVYGILKKFPPPLPPPPVGKPFSFMTAKKEKPESLASAKNGNRRKPRFLEGGEEIEDLTNNNNNDNDNDEASAAADGDGEGDGEGYGDGEEEEEEEEEEGDEDAEDDEDDEQEQERYSGGVMVPFIYPPPPVVDFDALPFSLGAYKKRYEEALKTLSENEMKELINGTSSPIPEDHRYPERVILKKRASALRKGSMSAEPPSPEESTSPQPKSSASPEKKQDKPSPSAPLQSPPPPPPPQQTQPPLQKPEAEVKVEAVSSQRYIQAPPLPFPPPNFMAYPLSAQHSTMTPEDVFEAFLDANSRLPRTDMVVASAAGSIADMRKQATEEGFNLRDQKISNRVTKGEQAEDEPCEVSSDNDEEDEELSEGELEERTYYDRISTNVYEDLYAEEWKAEDESSQKYTDPNFAHVDARHSDIKHGEKGTTMHIKQRPVEDIYSFSDPPPPPGPTSRSGFDRINRMEIFPTHYREITLSTGNNKQRRRKNLRSSLDTYENWARENRDRIYRAKKSQLLRRLKLLQSTRIGFRETSASIKDPELANFVHQCEVERDYEITRIKLSEKYQLLKNSLIFYHDSNHVYKHMNSLLINKLEKLKNFFGYQRDLFEKYLKNPDSDIFDIASKDSSKLFHSIATSCDGNANGGVNGTTSYTHPDTRISNLVQTTFKHAIVHDFMPLITQREFVLITSDLHKKNKSDASKAGNSMKHKIFKNPLYMTSGSDTNASDSNAGGTTGTSAATSGKSPVGHPPKRRGRRAAAATTNTSTSSTTNGAASANNSNSASAAAANQAGSVSGSDRNSSPFLFDLEIGRDEEISAKSTDSKHAFLMNRIHKHWQPNFGASSDEIDHDFKLMGIETKWPVAK